MFFSCSIFENNYYIHASEVPFVRKRGTHLKHETVDGETLANAIITKIGPAMKIFGSTLAVLDCVQVNDHKNVIAAFKKFGISVYPSGGHPHNVLGGYPPYSCSPLDNWLFRPYQSEIATFCKARRGSQSVSEGGMMVQFLRHIGKLWQSDKYTEMSRDAVNKMSRTLNDIVLSRGAQR